MSAPRHMGAGTPGEPVVYRARVGRPVARWLADPVRGPLGSAGFYQADGSGGITDLRDGWVQIDGRALEALRGLPADRDGHVTDEDGPTLWIGKDGYRLTDWSTA